MSGGHFEYKEKYLKEIIGKLECDMREYHDIILNPEIVKFTKRMIRDLRKMHILLKAYDFMACDDTSEKDFLNDCYRLLK